MPARLAIQFCCSSLSRSCFTAALAAAVLLLAGGPRIVRGDDRPRELPKDGVWVRYQGDQPQFTLNLWFVPNSSTRTLYAQALPLTDQQRLQLALDDRPRIVAAVLNECLAAVAERRRSGTMWSMPVAIGW